MKKTKEAFLWIISILVKHKVPYRISGGFAAKIYGSKRRLRDIDIEIPDKQFNKILPDIREYISEGPGRFIDDKMKTYGLVMEYKGQIIEFSGTDTEILFDFRKKKWVRSKIDISKISRKRVYGKMVNVIKKKDLLAYKTMIQSRPEDLRDINAIS